MSNRTSGVVMTSVAALLFFSLQATVLLPTVHAARCIQECFAEQAACYATCDEVSHNDDGDSWQLCRSDCDDAISECTSWAYTCEPPYESICYHYTIFDTYYWVENPPQWLYWKHEFTVVETGAEFCS